jgi:putative hemolysin
VRREDGSWLVDGALTMDEFWDCLGLEDRRGEERIGYNTLGGLVVTSLGRIPHSGDAVEVLGLRLEVMDMDGHRVDKVLVDADR